MKQKNIQYLISYDYTNKSCSIKLMFELAVNNSLGTFFINSLKKIVKNDERSYSSFFFKADDNYAIHLEGISKSLAQKKNLNKSWMYSGEGCFRDKENLILCLKMSFRKRAAKRLLKNVFLRKTKWGCIELDHNVQYSLKICGDIQNTVSFLNQSYIDDIKDNEGSSVQNILNYSFSQSDFDRDFDRDFFDDVSEISNHIIY